MDPLPNTPTKKRALRTILIGLVLLLVAYSLFTYSEPVAVLAPSVALNTANVQSTDNFPWPTNVSSEAAVTVNNAGVLATKGDQIPLPTASTAKIMTALAVLNEKPLALGEQGPEITITGADVTAYQADLAAGDSVVQVATGEQLTEYQALQALLLPSGDNIADLLANWAFGSVSAYTSFANSYGLSLGMKASHFADASGLSPQTVSTASDLVDLTSIAMSNPVFAQIVSQSHATIPIAGEVSNVDNLIGQNGIIGVKTGNTPQAGGCFVVAATEKLAGTPVTVLAAVMGASDLDTALTEGQSIVQRAEETLRLTTVIHAGQKVGTYAAPWGETFHAVAVKSVSLPLWTGEVPQYRVSLTSTKVPLKSGRSLGTVGVTVGKTELSAKVGSGAAFTGPSWWWRFTHPRF